MSFGIFEHRHENNIRAGYSCHIDPGAVGTAPTQCQREKSELFYKGLNNNCFTR